MIDHTTIALFLFILVCMASLAGGIMFYECLLIRDGKASAGRRTTYRLTSAILMIVGIFTSAFARTK